jgi:cysteinyl-tRNA synthetase
VNRSQSTASAGLLRALGATIGLLQHDAAKFIQGALHRSGSVFTSAGASQSVTSSREPNVEDLITERNTAKKEKNFARADEIRKQLDAAGIVLEDKPGGMTEWRRK